MVSRPRRRHETDPSAASFQAEYSDIRGKQPRGGCWVYLSGGISHNDYCTSEIRSVPHFLASAVGIVDDFVVYTDRAVFLQHHRIA